MRRPKRTVRVGEARMRCAVMRVVSSTVDVCWCKGRGLGRRAQRNGRAFWPGKRAAKKKRVSRVGESGLLLSLIHTR